MKAAKVRKVFDLLSAKKLISAPVLLWGLCGVFFAGSYYLSAQSSLPAWTGIRPRVLYHVVHMLEFGILAVILSMALRRTFKRMSLLAVTVLVLAVATAWAFLDEYHQMFVPGRHGNFFESFIDTLGAIAGIGVWVGVMYLRRLKQSSHSQPTQTD